jgi:hypothetical protein
MNILFHIPTSLSTPEFEILLSKAQNLINDKKKVTILTCPGGKNYSCSINLYSNPLICSACNYKKKKAFERINGKYNLEYTNIDFPKRILSFKSLDELKKINFDDADIGLASYASYLDNTKDYKLEGRISNKILLNNLNTTLNLYIFYKKFIKKNFFDLVYIYNGRQNQYRPLARLLNNKKIRAIFLEFKGPNYTNVYEFINHLAVDYNYIALRMKQNYRKLRLSKNKKQLIVDKFFRSIKNGEKIQRNISFNKNQIKNKLPVNFNKKDENIVFFISSEFEYAGLGGVYDEKIYESQVHAIEEICKDLSKSKRKINIWLRMHPNLSDVRWTYMKKFYDLEKIYNFLKVINASSKISSYSLLSCSSKVITYGSRMGIEAIYEKKPSIILSRNSYEKLNGNYIPKSHREVMKLIYSKLKPKPTLASEKFALWATNGGSELLGFKGSYDNGFEFHNNKITLNTFYKVLYVLGRATDKIYFHYFRNLGIKLLIKTEFFKLKNIMKF